MGIQVKCRKCGKMAESTTYILDPVFAMMVCPNCVKARRAGKDPSKEAADAAAAAKKAEPAKPAGWDREDDYLNHAFSDRDTGKVKVTRLTDEIVQYKCPECNYSFKLDVARKKPGVCPYCSSGIHPTKY